MNTDNTVKSATFYILKDGEYEKICDGIQEINIEDELSHRPDLVPYPQSFEFSCEVEFRASLFTFI